MSLGKPDDRRAVIAIAAILLAAIAVFGPARAEGDGLPVPGGVDTTHAGVLSADGTQRYLAIPSGGDTIIERVDARNGVMQASRTVPGTFAVPGVSTDGDTSGLSENGRTLVLIEPRIGFPRRSVRFIVVDPESLRVRRKIQLDGDFSFDAISPSGRTAYLVQYPLRDDPTEYRLRRLRVADGRLLPGSLLPANDPEEEMRGFPASRVAGPGGRWQYTFYDGTQSYGRGSPGPPEPFVHALDTVGAKTLCIDLDWIPPRRINAIDLRMSADGSEVEVVDPASGVIGRIETATGEARQVSEPFAAAPDASPADDGGGAGGIVVAIGSVAAGVALLFLLWRRRRPKGLAEPA
jgi:hypothetical protein